MRMLSMAMVLAVLGSAAVAQSNPPKGKVGSDGLNRTYRDPAAEFYSGPGRDEVGPDGISTKVVKAAPCSTAARETDGSTTCIGIPGPVRAGGNFPAGTTTGMSR